MHPQDCFFVVEYLERRSAPGLGRGLLLRVPASACDCDRSKLSYSVNLVRQVEHSYRFHALSSPYGTRKRPHTCLPPMMLISLVRLMTVGHHSVTPRPADYSYRPAGRANEAIIQRQEAIEFLYLPVRDRLFMLLWLGGPETTVSPRRRVMRSRFFKSITAGERLRRRDVQSFLTQPATRGRDGTDSS